MYVDIWIFALFAGLFGLCAIWNRNAGIQQGIEGTLQKLIDEKVIRIVGDEVVPCNRQKKRRNKYV